MRLYTYIYIYRDKYAIYHVHTIYHTAGRSGGTQGGGGAGSTLILSGGTGRPREPEGSQEAEGAGSSRRPGLGYLCFFLIYYYYYLFFYLLCFCWVFEQSIWGDRIWSLADKTAQKAKNKRKTHILGILKEIIDFLKNLLILVDFYWNQLDFIWNPLISVVFQSDWLKHLTYMKIAPPPQQQYTFWVPGPFANSVTPGGEAGYRGTPPSYINWGRFTEHKPKTLHTAAAQE